MNSAALVRSDIDLLDVQLYTERREQDAFTALRAAGVPTFHNEPGGPGFFALTRFDHVWAAARDNELFLSGQGTQIADKRAEGKGAPSVHNADPPLHSRLRGFGRSALSRPLLEARRAQVREIIADIVSAVPRGEPFDFVSQVALPIPMTVFGEVLGIPAEDRKMLVDWANIMSSVTATDAEQAAARADLFSYFRELGDSKRRQPGNDVASLLVAPDDHGEVLSQAELDAYFLLLVVAGNETTRFLLAGGLEQLLMQPGSLAQLRQSPALIESAVEEMVRWVTPVIHMRRTLARDCDLFGVPAQAGDKVVLYFSAANRDEATFDGPHQFDVARQPNRHVGFGAGHHFCLGAYLARMEAQLFFELFLEAFQEVELISPGKRLPSHWFAGLESLEVRWS